MTEFTEVSNYTSVTVLDYVTSISDVGTNSKNKYGAIITFAFKGIKYKLYVSHSNNIFEMISIHHQEYCTLCGYGVESCKALEAHEQEVLRTIAPLVRFKLLFS